MSADTTDIKATGADGLAALEGRSTAETFGIPLAVLAELTHRCPLQCPYCSNPLAMERGGEDPTAEGWIEVAEGIIEYVPVRTPIQREALSQFFIEANELETARDDRLAAVDGFVPTPAWIVLILGGVMVIGYAATFADPRERTAMQGVTIGAIATVIVSGLLLIAFFDAPYADRPGSVKPTAMEAALDQLELKRLAAPAAGPLPCDFSGRPQAAA